MHAAALDIDLRIHGARTRKDKRRVVRSLVDGARHRFGVAVAECDHLDRVGRAGIGVATVGESASHVRDVLSSVERWVWSRPDVEVIAVDTSWLESEATR